MLLLSILARLDTVASKFFQNKIALLCNKMAQPEGIYQYIAFIAFYSKGVAI